MRQLFTLVLCYCYFASPGQIISPDTICAGTTVNFMTPPTATTYSWDFNSVSVVQPISPTSVLFAGGFTSPSWACFQKDGANYYAFVTEYNTQQIVRLSYGTNMHSTPTVTYLGSFGFTRGRLEGIDIVKDSATGNWYGLAVNDGQMGVLSFGPSLASTPSVTVTSYPALLWSHQVTIKRYGGNWIAFVANRNSCITRFDFGSSLTSVPAVTNIPNAGSVSNPCNFSLYKESGNWYMLVTSLITATITRYDFGANLQNNSPTGTLLPAPAAGLVLPRYICLLPDCQGHLLGYIGNETGDIIKLDFAGSITNIPVFTNLGPSGTVTVNAAIPLSYDDTFSIVFVNYSAGTLFQYHPFYFSVPTFINYHNPTQPYTYVSPGTYSLSLFCDLGYASGPSVFCKSIVVVPASDIATRRDTTICTGTPLNLYGRGSGPYLWSTGATSSSIIVTMPGTYWVVDTNGTCSYNSDTTVVNYSNTIPIHLGDDTAFCIGQSIVLTPVVPAGSVFTWSTGSSGGSIVVNTTGTYWVKVVDGICSGADTIHVLTSPKPPVDLGPDTIICIGQPVALGSSDSYTSPSYLWNTGSMASTISPDGTGTYWLSVTVAGCANTDSVKVTMDAPPELPGGGDTTICPGTTLVLSGADISGAQYSWSTGDETRNITISQPGMYTYTVTIHGCKASAAINVTPVSNEPISLGADTSLCNGDVLYLGVEYETARWSNNHVGRGIKVEFPGTYWVSVPEVCGIVNDTVNVDFHMCDIGFPSAFTPNRDGRNDVIGVLGTLMYYKDFSLSIYNRWGERVYYSTDIYAGWDGIYNGVEQDLGTYFYMIYYTLESKKHMMKGDFELIR